MKRYVVLSTNNNPDYFAYLPYQEKAWKSYGWDLIVMITPDVDLSQIKTTMRSTLLCQLPAVNEIRSQTLAQMGRLYAAHYVGKDSILMTCDMDLIPLSNYWHPDPSQITVFGHDLTDYTYYPMGYVAMTQEKWIEKMHITNDIRADILRDCATTIVNGEVAAYSENWGSWWQVDWRLLTDRLMPFKDDIIFVTRGRGHSGFAYGRVDRGDCCVVPPGETLVDFHADNVNVKHPDKWTRFLKIYESVHGKL
jgi:hypothetical protein